ncbi:hypothetical protein FJT64_022189 [Amphibalanus amphitrite]|uniref:Uncharacterized protein n=1 Tax=Amphibalanus amphitrite TaxID=1232801 RepID=A0A6A4WLZ4_AMPAM|nr:hypothetical protein FJT64_022189 [Amphibalanus amphitrite]
MQPLTACLLVSAALAGASGQVVTPWLDGYSGQHQTGSLITYHDSASSLGGWNDVMRSACINGFWVFFEHDQFNYDAGRVLWSYGFNYCFTFKADFDQQTSSIRRVGDYYDAAADSLSLYEGTYFSGKQVFTESYLSTIGTSNDSAVSPSGQKITYGLFPTADYLGVVGSNIRSARKGCYSGVTLRGQPLTAENHISTVVEEDAASGGVGRAGSN